MNKQQHFFKNWLVTQVKKVPVYEVVVPKISMPEHQIFHMATTLRERLEQLLSSKFHPLSKLINSSYWQCTRATWVTRLVYTLWKCYLMGKREVYSLRPKISAVLVFKFCPTKSVVLTCNEIHLIKAISTKKALHSKTYRAN